MQRIVLHVEYDGTNYCGWQTQKNGVSIQQKLEEAILRRTGESVQVYSSGRTDAGVHALSQVVHFDTQSKIPPERFSLALNTALPEDIRIKQSFLAPKEDFHARYCAKGKHYRYIIKNSPHAGAIDRLYTMWVPTPLDVSAMQLAAKHMEGTHDFSAFCAQGTDIKSKVRTVHRVEVQKQEDRITVDVFGNGFLYNMVRIMVGTLIAVGLHKKKPDDVAEIIEKKERVNAGLTAQPQGLFLVEVFYE